MSFSNRLQKLISADPSIRSQSDFAKKTGLSRQAVNLLLLGKRKRPTEYTLQKIANYFNSTPAKIMGVKEGFSISEELGKLMKYFHISQSELSRKTGVPRESIKTILSEKHINPLDETISPICDFFGISIKQMRGEDEIEYNKLIIKY